MLKSYLSNFDTIDDIIDKDEFINSNLNSDGSLSIYIGEIKNFPNLDPRINIDEILCLRYNKGVGFKKHTHIKITDNHLGDIIIFPPSSLSPFKGGDLIIYHEDRTEIIKTDNLTEWKIVELKLGVPHEVTEIEEGIRYSFKFDLFSE